MTWGAVAGAAIGVAGGMLSGSKARKAQGQQELRRNEAAMDNLMWEQGRSDMMRGYADQYGDYAQRPTSSTSGYGTSFIDPTTGQTRFDLNSDYAGMRGQMFSGANKAFGLAGDFDPKAHAAERYAAAQGLLAEGDAQAQSGLMMDLYNKGGFGLRTNQKGNPYVADFQDSVNDRNAKMSYNSLREGESYLDNLINRGTGLFNSARGIDALGASSMQDAMNYRNQFNNDYRGLLGMRMGADNVIFDSMAAKNQAWAGGNPGFGANNQSQQWAEGAGELKGMIGKVDWSKMFGGNTYSPNTGSQWNSGYFGGSGAMM